MTALVASGATLSCSQGLFPGTLLATSQSSAKASGPPLATVNDFQPLSNILSFGMCNTQGNPAVAAATTAALGVHTPAPCIPAVVAPWSPGASRVRFGSAAALTADSRCTCSYGGQITVTDPAQQRTDGS